VPGINGDDRMDVVAAGDREHVIECPSGTDEA
jgi:hypothetical protein